MIFNPVFEKAITKIHAAMTDYNKACKEYNKGTASDGDYYAAWDKYNQACTAFLASCKEQLEPKANNELSGVSSQHVANDDSASQLS